MLMGVSHIAHLVLAAHGFRDFEENLPLVTDVHGESTVIATPFLVLPDLLKTSGQALHSMSEFPICEVLGVKVGVCIHSYLGMADNRDTVCSLKHFVLGGEHPIPVTSTVPIVGGDPPLSLVRMAAFRPPP